MKIQNFIFQGESIRTKYINGDTWFVAKDVCRCLGISNDRDAVTKLSDEDTLLSVVPTGAGKRKTKFINESGLYDLVFQSRKEEARIFRRWVTKDVIPSIRKTGSYNISKATLLNKMLLDAPSEWQKTFPDEFFLGVHRIYGHGFSRSVGTYGFVGKFINKYIYDYLLEGLSIELKEKRALQKGSSTHLHQYLQENAKEVLTKHIDQLTAILRCANSSEHFENLFKKFTQPNQMVLVLK